METNELKTGNWFVDKLNYYQAANSDNESLKKNFVIRKAEFELIIEALRSKNADDPLQHELVLGRRGSGKSTLLKRIQIEIEEEKQLSEKYIAINLAEEQAGIYRLSDLWFEVWQELKSQLNISASLLEFSTFNTDQDYTRYLFSEIHKVLTEAHKKAVILLDNLDRILENLDDDGNLLRELLLNYNDIQLIGGSTRMDEHFWQYDKPFYEFFRRHRLESLTFEEINLLLNQWSEVMNFAELHNYASKNRGKIEAIRILTDGLPRTLQFFIQILLHESDLYGFDYIRKVMDKATPLYQERLNSLTAAQRKIVLEMAFLWEACSTKQLVDKCRMEGKLISSYLKQLSGYGIVEILPTQTKNHLYRLSERFFNMWLIITQGNPDQKRKAKWLTIFLETWYDAIDLKNLAYVHINRLQGGNLSYDKASVLTKALSQSKYVTTSQRDVMIDLTNALNEIKKESNLELPKKFDTIWDEVIKLENEDKLQEALQKVNEIENEEDDAKFYLLGHIYYKLGDEQKSEFFNLKAIEKNSRGALYNLAYLYDSQEKIDSAKAYYLKAAKNGIIRAYNNLGRLFEKEGNLQNAKLYYGIGHEKGDINSLYNLAILYDRQGDILKAEKCYFDLIERGEVNSIFNLALLYDKQGNLNDAEKYYQIATEKGDVRAAFNLAILNYEQNRIEDAEKYYLLAIEKGDTTSLFNLAMLYDKKGDIENAEKYYLIAIEKGNTNALFNLGYLYSKQGKFQEVERYYLLAINNGEIYASYNLANLYTEQGKYQEAEKYYLIAIENGEKKALINLANLYLEQELVSNAEKYFLLAINEGDFKALFNLANFYHKLKREQEAEKYYLLAIDKGDIDAMNNLAVLYKDQGDVKNAENYYLKAIKEGEIYSFGNLAALYYENNQHKNEALLYINKFLQENRDENSFKLAIIIEIWNGIFENVDAKINKIFTEFGYENLDWFIESLLYQEQKHLILSLFKSEQHGKELVDRYSLLYYTTLILTNKFENNIEIRIPPEVLPTVQEIVKTVIEQNVFYAQ
jgi:TPR repeat protein